MLEFWAERLAPQGIGVDSDRYLHGHHNSFTAMSRAVIEHLRPGEPLDLIIAAHATPDFDSRMSLAGSLAAPGTLVFAVSDQGRLAPFSALRTALGFPDRPRALIVILDQGTFPYPDTAGSLLGAAADHAVGLAMDPGGAVSISPPRQWCDLPTQRVAAVLTDELNALAPDLVIVGSHVPAPAAFRVRVAPDDQLCTGVWSALAQELAAEPDRPRRIVVADHEPELACLGLVCLDVCPT